jgi:hypothetical protein
MTTTDGAYVIRKEEDLVVAYFFDENRKERILEGFRSR